MAQEAVDVRAVERLHIHLDQEKFILKTTYVSLDGYDTAEAAAANRWSAAPRVQPPTELQSQQKPAT